MQKARTARVPLRVRFWLEDEVWNGIAEDLPVAVFADTLDEAVSRLRAAVEEHMNVAAGVGLAAELLRHLTTAAESRHVVEDEEVGVLFGREWLPLPATDDAHA